MSVVEQIKATEKLQCPHCGAAVGARVLDSRASGGSVRRRRGCNGCGRRYTTWEIVGAMPPDRLGHEIALRAGGLRLLADQLEASAKDIRNIRRGAE